jgi:16S rRNA (adenine1518-N6/adenine1519-N6)-dimethyltransferase
MDRHLLPEIQAVLNTLNIRPHKLRGQNFLVSQNIVDQIVSLDPILPEMPVLEIGAGLGALSKALSERTNRLDLLEIEPCFAQRLEQLFAEEENIKVHLADVLCFNYVSLYRSKEYLIYGNIPYNITTPLLKKLFYHGANWRRMTLMLQKEAAERLVRGQGRENGPLPLMLDYFGIGEIRFIVPKEAFYPMPAVMSAVITIDRHIGAVPNQDFLDLFAFIEAAFAQRRKTLANVLAASSLGGDRGFWQELFCFCGFSPNTRAEELSLDDFQRLYCRYQKG